MQSAEMDNSSEETASRNPTEKSEREHSVSGVLYAMLREEVITLRKACNDKDQSIKEKDDAIEVRSEKVLANKYDMLNKPMEIESRRMRRENGRGDCCFACKQGEHSQNTAPRCSQCCCKLSSVDICKGRAEHDSRLPAPWWY